MLARTWQNISADEFELPIFAEAALAAADRLDPALGNKLAENFAWREII